MNENDTVKNPKINACALQIYPTRWLRVKRGDIDLGTFEASESWNGMVTLTNREGEVLITDAPDTRRTGGFAEAFGDIFGEMFGRQAMREVDLLKASPSLLEKVYAKPKKADAPESEEPKP